MRAEVRGRRSIPIAACWLVLTVSSQASAAGATPPGAKQSGDPGSLSPQAAQSQSAGGVIKTWDETERSLRESVWRTYTATAAYGKDVRGRTVKDDLNVWVMTTDVRDQLEAARLKAEQQLQAGDSQGAEATWRSAHVILDQQLERIEVIGLYWSQRMDLERVRSLWQRWLSGAPNDVAAASRDRIDRLVSQLATDLQPTMELVALMKEMNALKAAYDEERRKLAALVSEREVTAGQEIASRDQSFPCAEVLSSAGTAPNPRARNDPQSGNQRLPEVWTSPSAERYYPAVARRQSITGDVILRVTVGVDGCMKHAEITSSSGAPELDDEALDLVERATFRPGEVEGKVVEASLSMKYHFVLDRDQPNPGAGGIAPAENAGAHVDRGNELLNQGSFDQAITELDRTIALEPRNAMAFADRGMAYLWKRDAARAKSDLDAAFALDPRNPVVFRGRGMLALQAGDSAGAISDFTEALGQNAHDLFSLQYRAEAYRMVGELDHALEDLAEIIRDKPGRTDLYSLKALLLRVLHKPDEALREAEAVVAANPKDAQAALVAGYIYEASGKADEGMRSFDRAVELGGREADYLTRARYRPKGDLAARQADVEGALKLNPKSDGATVFLAQLQEESGDVAGAIATLTAALAARPSSDTLLLRRGILYVKNQEQVPGEKDLGEVGARALGAAALNNVCWSLGTAGVELGATAILDSRGLVLLRLGRLQEAIAAYDEALKKRALAPTSLYARGIAKQRLGDRTAGDADIAAALVMDASTKETFAGYGVK